MLQNWNGCRENKILDIRSFDSVMIMKRHDIALRIFLFCRELRASPGMKRNYRFEVIMCLILCKYFMKISWCMLLGNKSFNPQPKNIWLYDGYLEVNDRQWSKQSTLDKNYSWSFKLLDNNVIVIFVMSWHDDANKNTKHTLKLIPPPPKKQQHSNINFVKISTFKMQHSNNE